MMFRRLSMAVLGAALLATSGEVSAQARAATEDSRRAAPDTSTVDFTTRGVRVILRRNDANDVIAANLYLLGGVRQASEANAGIEPFLFAASARGTAKYPGERARLTA